MTISLYAFADAETEGVLSPNAPRQAVAHGDNVILSRFSGGEWHISGTKLTGPQIAFVQGATPDDLMCLLLWADAVHRDGGVPYILMPYLPGARQDRRLPGESLSAAVYSKLINQCNADRVICLDPHSDVMPTLVDNCAPVPLPSVVRQALALNPKEHVTGIIAPDYGATRRASLVADELNLPLFQALKRRDPSTRRLTTYWCEPLPDRGRFLVVDDICDGGGTPIGLSEKLNLPRERLALWASHGIFAANIRRLGECYSAVYTTDSHADASMHSQQARTEAHSAMREFVLPILPILLKCLGVTLGKTS